MNYPNKVFVANSIRECEFGTFKSLVIVAADSKETAEKYLFDKLNIDFQLTWLMDCNYKVVLDQLGLNELDVQAKILYNSCVKMT